jgi:hypothetical protein
VKVWIVEPDEAQKEKEKEQGKEPKKMPRVDEILASADVIRVRMSHEQSKGV